MHHNFAMPFVASSSVAFHTYFIVRGSEPRSLLEVGGSQSGYEHVLNVETLRTGDGRNCIAECEIMTCVASGKIEGHSGVNRCL